MRPEQWLQAVFARVTYRPDWRLRLVLDARSQFPQIIVTRKARDSEAPDNPNEIPLAFYWPLPSPALLMEQGEEVAIQEIGYAIRQLEQHEFDEWFRVDGKMVRDPHATDAFTKA